MKIVVINKTLNEERNIYNFCNNHDFADLILIADGGSHDKTIEIANSFANVKVRQFDQRVALPGGNWMNPEPSHVNFLIDWATEESADWILFVGCDTWPNKSLQKEAREIFANAERSEFTAVLIHQFYMWGDFYYYPRFNKPGAALWGWRPRKEDLHCDEKFNNFFDVPFPAPVGKLHTIKTPPHVLLHYIYPDEKVYTKKMTRYKEWGYPLVPINESIYAPAKLLPKWVRINGDDKDIPEFAPMLQLENILPTEETYITSVYAGIVIVDSAKTNSNRRYVFGPGQSLPVSNKDVDIFLEMSEYFVQR